MRSLFVMDPLDRIQVAGDSTYALMRECTARGWPISYCTPDDLYVRDGRAYARVSDVLAGDEPPWFEIEGTSDADLCAFDVVWMRKDPPYDMAYLAATFALDFVAAPTLVVNDPRNLRVYNEKMWAMHWPQFQPATLLSANKARITAFVNAQPGGAVLKPWDGNGGRGVLVTRPGDPNLPSMIELLTKEGREVILAQAYLPGVVHGDKRILLFDGEPVGAVLRVPGAGDHRANLHVGSRAAPCELDARDREICAAIGPALRAAGMIFVGIDVIDGHLTEINVTSPTGVRDLDRLYGGNHAGLLLDRVYARVNEDRS
jgi:glutathione synthase